MTYKLTQTTTILRIEDGAYIPADPTNADYQEYQIWLAEGNAPLPAEAPSKRDNLLHQIAFLESQVTSRRVREAVLGVDNGWLKDLDAQILALRSQL